MKRLIALLLSLLVLLAVPAAAEIDLPDFSENCVPYENEKYGYSLNVPGYLITLPDATIRDMIDNINREEEKKIYDLQGWMVFFTETDYLMFTVEVKQPSYGSLSEEIANWPGWIDEKNAELEKDGSNVRLMSIHDGKLHDTPAGVMFEEAFKMTLEGVPFYHALYYDFYLQNYEFCFTFETTCLELSYETLSALLDRMMQTVQIKSMYPLL